jgi:hypothetical protein
MMEEEGTFSTNRPAVVPYDTGKVKIGCRYEPPAVPLTDEEMQVQQMLLGTSRHTEDFWKMHGEWMAVVAICVMVVMLIQ